MIKEVVARVGGENASFYFFNCKSPVIAVSQQSFFKPHLSLSFLSNSIYATVMNHSNFAACMIVEYQLFVYFFHWFM